MKSFHLITKVVEIYLKKLRYVRLVPVKKYLNKIDKVNSNKLKEHGVKGFAFQIELSQETIDYLNNI